MANIKINDKIRDEASWNDGLLFQIGTTPFGVYKSINIDSGTADNDYIPTSGYVNDVINYRLPNNQIVINSISDLPTPQDLGDGLGEAYRLPVGYYILGNNLVWNYPIAPTATPNEVVGVDGRNFSTQVYTGTGAFIRANTTNNFGRLAFNNVLFVGNGSNQLFDVTGDGNQTFLLYLFTAANFGSLGTITAQSLFAMYRTVFSNFSGKLTLFNNTINYTFAFATQTAAPIGDAHIRIEGAGLSTAFTSCQFVPIAGDSVFDIDLASSGFIDITNSNVVTAYGGIPFKAGSADQTDPRVIVNSTRGIPNSTAKAKLTIVGNTATTIISTVDTPTVINTIWGDGNIEELFVYQDACTFDNTIDTITTTFNHELSNNDLIKFHTITGTLPTGLDAVTIYYARDVTATTFKVETSIGGGAVDFTTDGVGTNYYRHTTGKSDSGWSVYIGSEVVSVRIAGWATITGTTGTAVQVHVNIMKVDTDGSVTSFESGSFVNVSSAITASSQLETIMPLTYDQGTQIYISNKTTTNDLIVTDAVVSITKS